MAEQPEPDDALGQPQRGEAQHDLSLLGRFVRPAGSERKLVLFTLGIIVVTIIVGTLLYVATEETPSEGTITALTTLAGTGLGFIGGMVSKQGDAPSGSAG